jgi:hypothetical protein
MTKGTGDWGLGTREQLTINKEQVTKKRKLCYLKKQVSTLRLFLYYLLPVTCYLFLGCSNATGKLLVI